MTIIAFLIDTSPSMCQHHYLGTSYLDYARQVVELFLKQRQRDTNASKGDRYMLMTFDEYPKNIKSGWKEGQTIFNEQLRAMGIAGVSDFGAALESVLHFLNLNRLQFGTDNWGWGRNPSYLEQVYIVAITDGATANTFLPSIPHMKGKMAGTKSHWDSEVFRWDQRLFTIALRLAGTGPRLPSTSGNEAATPQSLLPPPDASPIDTLCTAMGGQSFALTSHQMLPSVVDYILQKITSQSGALIRLEFAGPVPPPPPATTADEIPAEEKPAQVNGTGAPALPPSNSGATEADQSWRRQLVTILKPKSVGHWPIPEAFWPIFEAITIPPRQPHPLLYFQYDAGEAPTITKDFPFDKYELSPSPLTDYILARQEPNVCWKVYAPNSSRVSGMGFPFGYIKASPTHQCISLFVLPYNFPKLLPLIEEIRLSPSLATSSSFRQRFDEYLSTVPSYYYSRLAKALKMANINLPKGIEEKLAQTQYNPDVLASWEKTKQSAKKEIGDICTAISKNLELPLQSSNQGPIAVSAFLGRTMNPGKVLQLSSLLQKYQASIPQPFNDLKVLISDPSFPSTSSLVLPSQQFKNPFDIRREHLLEQLDKMKVNFDLQVEPDVSYLFAGGMPGQKLKLQHAEDLLHQPVSKMGDYQEYMKRVISVGGGPLRELEPKATRQHAFGNPFKLDRKSVAEVDEVGDEVAKEKPEAESSRTTSATKREFEKRKGSTQSATASSSSATDTSRLPPSRLRLKRKQGPLDEKILMHWKRRRTSSVDSDLSSIYSDEAGPSELREEVEEGDEIEAGVEVEKLDVVPFEVSHDKTSQLLKSTEQMPSSDIERNSRRKKPVTEKCLHRDSSQLVNGSVRAGDTRPIEVHYPQNIPSMPDVPPTVLPSQALPAIDSIHQSLKQNSKEMAPTTAKNAAASLSNQAPQSQLPNKLREQSMSLAPPIAKVLPSAAGLQVTSSSATTLKQRNQKQAELSRIVRGVGNHIALFNKCLQCVRDLSTRERRILLGSAIGEARRFKREELASQLEDELHRGAAR